MVTTTINNTRFIMGLFDDIDRIFLCVFHIDKSCRYHKVPKFWDAKKLCCNLPKIQTKRPNLRVFCQNDAYGMANSVDPDQTAPLGAV